MTPLNCSRCGRFVGKDGDPDIWKAIGGEPAEIGYSRCGRCVKDDERRTPAARQEGEG